MTDRPDVVVVGAGVAGLFATHYLLRRGCRVTVLEHNHQAGGCLTGIWRKGFYFDAGDQSFEQAEVVFPLLQELGMLDDFTFERTWYRLVTPDVDATIDSEDALRRAFVGAFPRHATELDAMFDEVQGYVDVVGEVLARDAHPLWATGRQRYARLTRLAPKLFARRRELARMLAASGRDLAHGHLHDPMLREFFARIGYRDMRLAVFAAFIYCWAHDYWYPRGGLQAFCDRLVARAEEHGATFHFKATVEAVETAGRRATAVRLADGRRFVAPWVVYTGDLRKLAATLLPSAGPERTQRLARGKPSEALTSVYLGLNLPVEALRECLRTHHVFYFPSYAVHDPDTLDDPNLHVGSWLEVSAPCLTDESLVPAGKSAVVLQTMAHADWHARWDSTTGAGRSAYRALKRTVADQMCATAEALLPGLRDRIAWRDVGTPLSAERFTLNTNGASAGWSFDLSRTPLQRKFVSIVSPYHNLMTAGHWTLWPGGVPAAALSGKLAADAVTSRVSRAVLRVADRVTGSVYG